MGSVFLDRPRFRGDLPCAMMLTHDVLLAGVRREDVQAWLAEPDHHLALLRAAGLHVAEMDDHWRCRLPIALWWPELQLGFRGTTSTGGERRAWLDVSGVLEGTLRYSMGIRRPSPATLVTVHLEAQPRGPRARLTAPLRLQPHMAGRLEALCAALRDQLGLQA